MQCVPDMAWIRSVGMHQQESNDGARPRIPVVVGDAPAVFKEIKCLALSRSELKCDARIATVPYSAEVFIPGLGKTSLQDTALVVNASSERALLVAVDLLARDLFVRSAGSGAGAGADTKAAPVIKLDKLNISLVFQDCVKKIVAEGNDSSFDPAAVVAKVSSDQLDACALQSPLSWLRLQIPSLRETDKVEVKKGET